MLFIMNMCNYYFDRKERNSLWCTFVFVMKDTKKKGLCEMSLVVMSDKKEE